MTGRLHLNVRVCGVAVFVLLAKNAISAKLSVPIVSPNVRGDGRRDGALVVRRFHSERQRKLVRKDQTSSSTWLPHQRAIHHSFEHQETFLPHQRALGTGTINVQNCDDVEFYGLIGLGTPVQTFSVIFDTGSSDLWITGSECTTGDCTDVDINKYDHTASETYIAIGDAVSIEYEDLSSATGHTSADTLSLGNLQVTNQKFAEITQRDMDGCSQNDGIMGLGFDSLSEVSGTTPFHNLVNRGLLDEPVFSLYLNHGNNGHLLFGGADPEHYEGCLVDVPLTNTHSGYWEITMDDFTSKTGSSFFTQDHSSWQGIVDSGTSLIIGPYAEVANIFTNFGAECLYWNEHFGEYDDINCHTGGHSKNLDFGILECQSGTLELDSVYIKMNGELFEIKSEDFVLPIEGSGYCLLGFSTHDWGKWILGDTFMLGYYSVFDYINSKLSFASSTHHRTSAPTAHSCAGTTWAPTPAAPPGTTAAPTPTAPGGGAGGEGGGAGGEGEGGGGGGGGGGPQGAAATTARPSPAPAAAAAPTLEPTPAPTTQQPTTKTLDTSAYTTVSQGGVSGRPGHGGSLSLEAVLLIVVECTLVSMIVCGVGYLVVAKTRLRDAFRFHSMVDDEPMALPDHAGQQRLGEGNTPPPSKGGTSISELEGERPSFQPLTSDGSKERQWGSPTSTQQRQQQQQRSGGVVASELNTRNNNNSNTVSGDDDDDIVEIELV